MLRLNDCWRATGPATHGVRLSAGHGLRRHEVARRPNYEEVPRTSQRDCLHWTFKACLRKEREDWWLRTEEIHHKGTTKCAGFIRESWLCIIFGFHTYEQFIVPLLFRENKSPYQPEVELEMYSHLKKEDWPNKFEILVCHSNIALLYKIEQDVYILLYFIK